MFQQQDARRRPPAPTPAETPSADHPAAAPPAAARRGSPPRSPARAASAAGSGSRRSRSTPLARARSSSVACTPVSSIFRHRNARASALTMALSTRGRGAHGAPSGVTTSFRPPRFLNVVGSDRAFWGLAIEIARSGKTMVFHWRGYLEREAWIFLSSGILGSARGSLLTIHHGDWSAYPQGDDFHAPLIQLTAFPAKQPSRVDDMDDPPSNLCACEGRPWRTCRSIFTLRSGRRSTLDAPSWHDRGY